MRTQINTEMLDRLIRDFVKQRKEKLIKEYTEKFVKEFEMEIKSKLLEMASELHIGLEKNAMGSMDFIVNLEIKENNPKE